MRILFCGLSGIPNKASASINRYLAIGQAQSKNNEIIYINRFPLFKHMDPQSLQNSPYRIIDATRTKFRPSSFIKRNFLKLSSFVFEFESIWKINREKKIDWLNVYTQYFGIFLIYYFTSKIFRFKIILHYVEFRSKFNDRSFILRLNDLLVDKFAILLCDKIIPISTTLDNYISKKNSNINTLVIPPICDFNYFASIKPEVSEKKYFVFCSSINYEEVILFVIKSFLKIKSTHEVVLQLVINGKIENKILNKLIKDNSNDVLLFSNLKYENLIAKYKGSIAALVPLRDTIQDQARFPQKICEFLASNRPIITTSYGEIKHYFTDKINAIIANEYDIDSFSEQLIWALTHENELEVIAKNSYSLGRKYFDINGYSSKIQNFLIQ